MTNLRAGAHGQEAHPVAITDVVVFWRARASYVTGQCVVVDGGWAVQGMIGRPEGL